MNVTVRQILEAQRPLQRLMQQPFPGAVAFRLVRLGRQVDAELAAYQEAQRAMAQTYGERDEDGELITQPGGGVPIPEPQREAFAAERDELMATTVELAVDPLPVRVLNGMSISPADLLLLEWLIVDDE